MMFEKHQKPTSIVLKLEKKILRKERNLLVFKTEKKKWKKKMMMKKTSTTMIDFKLIFDREKEEKTFVKFHWIFDVFFFG